MRALLLLIAVAVLLAACGYKGPLYLPKDKPAAKKPAPAKPAPPVPDPEVAKPGA
jgi:predicted small lipoprotein YifL